MSQPRRSRDCYDSPNSYVDARGPATAIASSPAVISAARIADHAMGPLADRRVVVRNSPGARRSLDYGHAVPMPGDCLLVLVPFPGSSLAGSAFARLTNICFIQIFRRSRAPGRSSAGSHPRRRPWCAVSVPIPADAASRIVSPSGRNTALRRVNGVPLRGVNQAYVIAAAIWTWRGREGGQVIDSVLARAGS
ncbi:hypothetical protein AURDEDRAFT_114905 [Auricularia subglabra TFB-10046 SS5]|nr:hypothetical protein AURDEDRAFT_114905 [Auricularia subglabra TFB-10046 SS5]